MNSASSLSDFAQYVQGYVTHGRARAGLRSSRAEILTTRGGSSRLEPMLCVLEEALGLAEERDHTSVWRHEESSK